MKTFSHVTLLGNVGHIEVRTTPSGGRVARMSVAVNRRWKNADGNQQEQTSWFSVKAFNEFANVLERHVQKGDLVLVTGRLEANEHEGKKYTDIIADDVVWGLGAKRSEEADQSLPY